MKIKIFTTADVDQYYEQEIEYLENIDDRNPDEEADYQSLKNAQSYLSDLTAYNIELKTIEELYNLLRAIESYDLITKVWTNSNHSLTVVVDLA